MEGGGGGSVDKLNSGSKEHSSSAAADQAFDTTIKELYNNLCELQSSNQSPSRHSFGSYGDDKSKIDSDLQHLALGEMHDLDITEDEEEERDVAKPEDFDTVRPPSAGTTKSSPSKLDTEKQTGKKNANKPSLRLGGNKKKTGTTTKSQNGNNEEPSSENVELARFLLNQARNLVSFGDNINKALELSL